MIWVTADTNVIVSGLNFASGNPRRLLNLARDGIIRAAVSDAILDEVDDVLSRKFDWPEEDIAEVRSQLVRYGHKVMPCPARRHSKHITALRTEWGQTCL